MKTVAIFTVGGSPEPIINAIKELKPDFIYFICSSGTSKAASERIVDGKPLKEEEIIIKDAIELPAYEKILIPLEKVDWLDEVYSILEKELVTRIKEHIKNNPNLRIIANYTGGTKTMSAALVLFSIFEENLELQINTAERSNLIKVDKGDSPVAINKIKFLLKLDFKLWEELMQKFYYENILEKIKIYLRSPVLPSELKNKLINLKTLLSAFILWDTFNHKDALPLLERVYESTKNKKILQYYLTLKFMLEKKEKMSYEMVFDLLKNAERRALQKRFDDAVARLYRAIEMLAQIRLNTAYNIDPGNIEINTIQKLPAQAKEFLINEYEKNKDEKGKLKIALTKCYELLSALEDPVGIFYSKVKEKFLNTIKLRNNSILAHGIDPISEEQYKDVYEFVKNFICTTLEEKIKYKFKYPIPQFPQSFEEIELVL